MARKDPARKSRPSRTAKQGPLAEENARLRRSLAREKGRRRQLEEKLSVGAERQQESAAALDAGREQQAATAEILRLISISPSDAQPVFDAIARNAVRLCASRSAVVLRYDGALLHLAAHHNVGPEVVGRLESRYPEAPDRNTPLGQAVLGGTVVHVPDLQAAVEFSAAVPRQAGMGGHVSVPLLREGRVIGGIGVSRLTAGPFSDQQIALLQTFADQAVIAIENARLFREQQASNRDLTETLEQQTATAEILGVISNSPTDAQPVFDAIVRNAVRLCGALSALVVRQDGGLLHLAAHHNVMADNIERLERRFPQAPDRGTPTGRAFVDGAVVHVPDLQAAAEFSRAPSRQGGMGSNLAVPLRCDGRAIGVISVARATAGPFSERQIALLQTFADQAVIAIENARLFKELEARNGELITALARQTATSEVLRVISRNPTDVQPVFDAIVESAARLCGALHGSAFRYDGAQVHFVAHYNYSPEAVLELQRSHPRPLGYQPGPVDRAIETAAVVQVPDIEAAVDVPERVQAVGRALGARSRLVVPMLRDGVPIGVININRAEVGLFSDTEIGLLQTFAEQAVIAVENVRLFTELEARNADLTEAMEQQTATSEVLRAISGSPTDAQPVLDIIAQNATRVCGARDGAVLLKDGADLYVAAHHGPLGLLGGLGTRVPIGPDWVSGRAMVDRRAIQVEDLLAASGDYPRGLEMARHDGHRTTLVTPLLREGEPIGVLLIRRGEVRLFTPKQMSLLETFAAQAVIAIENVRLFNELAARNKDLTESLERQTATAEILRVISGSPTDIGPVLDAIAANAVRVCGAYDAVVLLREGDLGRRVAHHGPVRLGVPEVTPITRTLAAAAAILDRRVVHVVDALADNEFPGTQEMARTVGFRTALAVPLLREGEAIGSLFIRRQEVQPFTDKQIALLQTFADQAVIAIENVRLFNELAARNTDLSESLERQTATAEILRVISQAQTDAQPVFEAIADSAMRLFGAFGVFVFRSDGELIQLVAARGGRPGSSEASVSQWPTPRRPGEDTTMDRVLRTRTMQRILDVETDPSGAEMRERARFRGWRSTVQVPMLRGGDVIGIIAVSRAEAGGLAPTEIALLQTFADQAVIAVENARLFNELGARNKDLTESLERQTATAEILRVISQAQTDVQPVFEAIADSAMRLFGARSGLVFAYDGEFLRLAAARGGLPGSSEAMMARRGEAPERPTSDWPPGRAVLTGMVQHVLDVQTDASSGQRLREDATARGFRSVVAVPLFRGDEVVGVITVSRDRAGGFGPTEIALVQTFADQAVIAIENARLLTELQARTAELTRSVEQLTALGEVGRAVSSSVELETVLRTIVTRATQLAGTDGGAIYEYDEVAEEFQLRATLVETGEMDTARREGRLRKGEGAIGRLAETREPIQVPDITVEGAYQGRLREALIRTGVRSLLAVPIIREDRILGGLVLNRRAAGEFGPAVVEVLQTFATQSALAIHNARLFRELADKSRQLEVANRHKSEFLASMSHELRTPLNAIIGYSEMLQEEAQDLEQEALVPDLKKINAAGKHLLELINAVLDLSKIEAGRMDLYLETFSVPPLMAEIVAVVQPLADKNGNRLETVCAAELGEMRADLTKVRQTLFNLLSNACKFTERGTVTLSARQELGPDRSAPWMVFEVADTGIGLTQEQMGRLFEEFSQAEASTTRRYGGTGLGLALSRRLCRLMGGEVTVASELGRGSTFTVRLPREVAEPLPEQGAAPGAPGGQARAAAGGATVLVIDDDPAARDLLQRTLAREGFRVVLAAGGEEGLTLARELRPDTITLDVLMPGMDGWAVLAALKADPQTADIPVIMVSVLDERNLGYALGAADYLTKPIDRDRLLATLARHRRDLPVLIVEDDADLRALLRRLLEQAGYAVLEAAHGRAALDQVRTGRPGLVLLDLMMPGMDGFEFLEELRRDEAGRAIPVIVVTARDLSAEDRRRLNGQVERILEKGAYSREALLAEVRALVAASVGRGRAQGAT